MRNASATSWRAQFAPGQPDMWVFVLFEATTFAAYFIAYMLYRMGAPDLFLESQANLNQDFGAANTLLLLTSSLFMVRCVDAVRRQRHAAAQSQLLLTIACGIAFLSSKFVEWSIEIERGFVFSRNLFFQFYYFLTAIHVLHVLIGFIVLGVVFNRLRQPDAGTQKLVETGATYWHMVDFLWVIIFALLYVMR